MVLGCEVGGRWSEETQLCEPVGKGEVAQEPPQLKQPERHAWFRRWSTLLACSAARSFALSLLERRGGFGVDGDTPSATVVFEEFGQECRDW